MSSVLIEPMGGHDITNRQGGVHGQEVPGDADGAGAQRTVGDDWHGKADARKLAHARVLLQADEADSTPARTDETIASKLSLSTRTVERMRERLVEQGPKSIKRIYTRALDGARGRLT